MVSKKPAKQRKETKEMPLHQRKRLVSAHLSKELRDSLKRRSLAVRKGDTVKIMRGKYRGKTGKVAKVDLRKGRVYIENLARKKGDATEVLIPFNASNLMIVGIDRSDEKRVKHREKEIKEVKEKVK